MRSPANTSPVGPRPAITTACPCIISPLPSVGFCPRTVDCAARPRSCRKPPGAVYIESGKECVTSLPFSFRPLGTDNQSDSRSRRRSDDGRCQTGPTWSRGACRHPVRQGGIHNPLDYSSHTDPWPPWESVSDEPDITTERQSLVSHRLVTQEPEVVNDAVVQPAILGLVAVEKEERINK